MSKVSIVVPIYNPGNKLRKCINSVLSQSFQDFELILVNDGSTDDSLQVCESYCNLDDRIIVVDKKNEGTIATRRKGMEISKSDYILFVDADDWIHPTCVETLYSEIIRSNADILVCDTYKVISKLLQRKSNSDYLQGNKTYYQPDIKNELVKAYLYGHNFPATLHGKLYKKELLLKCGRYLDRIHFLGDDLYYNIELFLKANIVKTINIPLYYYRAGGFTSKYMPYLFEDMVNGYEIQKEIINSYFQGVQDITYNPISIMLLNTLKTCLHNLMMSGYNQTEIKNKIRNYVDSGPVKESVDNQGAIKFFPENYLHAIRNKDINFLYKYGKSLYYKSQSKKLATTLITKLS